MGVTGKYAYEVKSECLVSDMPDFTVADFLMDVTKRWGSLENPPFEASAEGHGRASKAG